MGFLSKHSEFSNKISKNIEDKANKMKLCVNIYIQVFS